jgi:hypothetical protein
VALRPVVVLVLTVALLAPAAAAQSASPKATLLQQASLVKQAKWPAMYATYTPRFRRSCPYPRFVQNGRQLRALLGTNFQVRGIQVRMESATRAILAYRFVRGGRTVASVTFAHRDVYTRIGSRWYDDLDRVSAC